VPATFRRVERVFVTGASGLAGTHLSAALLERGLESVPFSDSTRDADALAPGSTRSVRMRELGICR
jgi:nucleoside-diphosphate-sugar epimerase